MLDPYMYAYVCISRHDMCTDYAADTAVDLILGSYQSY
jgi:hypothetical protein